MPSIDDIADRLAHEVSADGMTLQTMVIQKLAALFAIFWIFVGFVDFEVIAPTGQFDAVVTEIADHLYHLVNTIIGPLARKKRYRSRHVGRTPLSLIEEFKKLEPKQSNAIGNCGMALR